MGCCTLGYVGAAWGLVGVGKYRVQGESTGVVVRSQAVTSRLVHCKTHAQGFGVVPWQLGAAPWVGVAYSGPGVGCSAQGQVYAQSGYKAGTGTQ